MKLPFLRSIVRLSVFLVIMAAGVTPAAAHGELVESRPAEDAVVGGEITAIELQFVAIRHPGDHRVSITGPDGTNIPTTGDLDQHLFKLTLPIEALTEDGEYLVNYKVDSVDGDAAVATFAFTYDASAPEAPALSILQISPDDSRAALKIVMAGTAVFAMALFAYIGRRLWTTRAGPADS